MSESGGEGPDVTVGMRLSRVPYTKGRVESEEVANATRPVYVLPGAYEMPADQEKKRKREPGEAKWTAACEAKALQDISNGKRRTN